MKCLRILPEICARTLRWPGRSTRNIVPGKTCVTVPSVMICSSFAMRGEYTPPACPAQGYGTRHAGNLVPVIAKIVCRSTELFEGKCWHIFGQLLAFPP